MEAGVYVGFCVVSGWIDCKSSCKRWFDQRSTRPLFKRLAAGLGSPIHHR